MSWEFEWGLGARETESRTGFGEEFRVGESLKDIVGFVALGTRVGEERVPARFNVAEQRHRIDGGLLGEQRLLLGRGE